MNSEDNNADNNSNSLNSYLKNFKVKIWDRLTVTNKILCGANTLCCLFIFVIIYYSFIIEG